MKEITWEKEKEEIEEEHWKSVLTSLVSYVFVVKELRNMVTDRELSMWILVFLVFGCSWMIFELSQRSAMENLNFVN